MTTLDVTIMGQAYRLACKEGEELALKQAVAYLDERMNAVREAGKVKGTDRIAVMREELSKMGADVEELSDGLIIRESKLRGAVVHSHDDHRIVMSLAIAATQAEGATTIEHAEAMSVTYPGFADSLRAIGGRAQTIAETAGVPA